VLLLAYLHSSGLVLRLAYLHSSGLLLRLACPQLRFSAASSVSTLFGLMLLLAY